MRNVSACCNAGKELGGTENGALRTGAVLDEAWQQLECTYPISCSTLINRDSLV